MNIFVGNLAYSVTEEDLRSVFEKYGEVTSSNIIMDRTTGRSRGFGFVEMPDKNNAEAAIRELNLAEFQGRAMTVNEAKPKTEGGRTGGGRGFGGGGGGGRFRRDRW